MANVIYLQTLVHQAAAAVRAVVLKVQQVLALVAKEITAAVVIAEVVATVEVVQVLVAIAETQVVRVIITNVVAAIALVAKVAVQVVVLVTVPVVTDNQSIRHRFNDIKSLR
jgi:hypothetical protein